MKNILQVSDPNVYGRYVNAPVLHPLISIVHYDEVSPIRSSLNRYGVYGLFIQRNFPKNLTYGMKMFDAADGSIIAVEPGQLAYSARYLGDVVHKATGGTAIGYIPGKLPGSLHASSQSDAKRNDPFAAFYQLFD